MFHYELHQQRAAELHRRAEQERLAGEAARGRRRRARERSAGRAAPGGRFTTAA